MSRAKLAIASTADGALPAQSAWEPRSKIVVAGVVVCAVALVAYAGPGLGPRASHMATHILLMSALAPFLAVLGMGFTSAPVLATGRALAVVTAAQLALLYAWHAPGASAYVERHPTAHLLMHASLLAAALLFWLAILGDTGSRALARRRRSGDHRQACLPSRRASRVRAARSRHKRRELGSDHRDNVGGSAPCRFADAGGLPCKLCPLRRLDRIPVAACFGGRSLARAVRSSARRLERRLDA